MSNKSFPKVSIVFANWNGGKKVIHCLESIKKLDYPFYEVIVVDNNSTDGSIQEIKKRFKGVKIIQNKTNLGCARALNQAFAIAKNNLILRLDSDVILASNLLKELVKVILRKEEIGLVVPKVYYYNKPKTFMGIGFSINQITGKNTIIGLDEEDKGQFNKEMKVDFVPGVVMLTKKEVLKKVGMMNSDYLVYYEDTELCLNIRKKGYKIIYTPTTKAWHDCNTFQGFTPFRIYNFIRSKLIYARRNSSKKNLIFFMLFFFFAYTPTRIISFLIKNKSDLIFPYFHGISAGLKFKI